MPTINGYVTKLRAFWTWCAKKRMVEEFPTIEDFPEPMQIPKAYSEDEFRALIAAFVAMWFNEATDSAWLGGIKPAIEQCGYDATRIDAVPHNGPIVDKILAEIRDSRFLVCDLTTDGADRGGVYFEAGFAMGLGMEVIFTFRDEPDSKGPHFDVAQYNQVRWTTPEELQERLQDRIVATIGRGPHAPPA